MSKPGRNDPCPCGSGKKYKQCCLDKEAAVAPRRDPPGQGYPSDPSGMLSAAVAAHRAGKLAQAEALYRAILRTTPRNPEVLHLLGVVAYQAGRFVEAVQMIGRAIDIDASQAGYYSNLGLAHEALQHLDRAAAAYRNALAIDPDFAEANCNLGGVQANLGNPADAVELCRRALARRPDLAEAWCNIGLAYYYQARFDLAVESSRKALAINPGLAQAWCNLGNSLKGQNRQAEAIECLERSLALKPDNAVAHGSLFFALLYRYGTTPAELHAAHRRYGAWLEAPLKAAWPRHRNPRDPGRRLKIGYLSPDFRTHSVARFMEPILRHHDRGEFEVHAYYNHVIVDDTTDRLRAAVDRWVVCKHLSDDELAARIQEDGIDILIDLAGHSANNRLLVFARKPAPVQVTYLGYPATTGLDAIDWRLTTIDIDPEGSEAFYSERLWRLPRSLWCYRPVEQATAAPDHDPPVAGRVCFGSINNFPKVTPEAVALWSRILRELPESRLVMTHVPEGSARRELSDRFTALGIEADRIQLHDRLPGADFASLLGGIDIALDPFPYNGTTTTCESLWMGVPVVTRIGDMSVSRSGHALLRQAGLDELCGGDDDEYVGIAVRLARDPDRLRALRSGLRGRLAASPLRDEAGFTRELEAAFRGMWREWCARGAGP